MNIAVFSDSHDNTDAITWVLHHARQEGCTYGIHCGDIVAGFSAQLLAQSPFPIIAVFGNNDGDHKYLRQVAAESNGILTFSDDGGTGTETIDNRTIFISHYPEPARHAASTGRYDAVFYGHTHHHAIDAIGNTLLCNPGELYGGRTGTISYLIYDTTRHTVRTISIPRTAVKCQ